MQRKTAKHAASAALMAGLVCATGAAPQLTSQTFVTPAYAQEEASYTIRDTYPSCSSQLETAAGQGATTLRLATDITDGGSVTIPSSISTFVGWQPGGWFDQEGIKTRNLGYMNALTVNFPAGSNTTVQAINFYRRSTASSGGASVVVQDGAIVHFINCTFSNTPEINGTAIFEDCTFSTGKVVNNGTCSYTGSTQKPQESGNPKQQNVPLSLTIAGEKNLGKVLVNDPVSKTLTYKLDGTNAEAALVSAVVTQSDGSAAEGLSVTASNGTLSITGMPTQAGSYTITLTATLQSAKSDTQTASQVLTLEVQPQIYVKLEGNLQAFTAVTGKSEKDTAASARNFSSARFSGSAGSYMVLASASGGGGTSQTDTNKLQLVVSEGDEKHYQSILDFQRSHPDAKVEFSITPEGSGMSASLVYDTVYVNGEPDTPGTYQVVATVTDGARTVSSNGVDLRIYSNDKTLAERFAALDSGLTSWDMEPYEIANTGNASVPRGLKNIYGSHESGVYGQIGLGDKDFDSETLTIPAGVDVTISNMKINSSVRVVVEAGGKLTLDDSVVYGPVDVYGTFSAKNSTATTSTVTLYDGARLEDAELRSHAHYLTDGSTTAPDAETPLVIDGNVTIAGENKITGDEGAASIPGQPAVKITSGTVTLEDGVTFEAQGGDTNAIYPSAGGAGIVMSVGTKIVGHGKVVAQGGQSYQKNAGHGIDGTGIVDVDELVATGGDSAPAGYPTTSGKHGQGGRGIAAGVEVRAKTLTVKGGEGEKSGSSEYTAYAGETGPTDSTNPTNPTNPVDPSGDHADDKDAGGAAGNDQQGDASATEKNGDTVKKTQKKGVLKRLPSTGDMVGIAGALAAVGSALALVASGALKRFLRKK
jgi:hypothetical protein